MKERLLTILRKRLTLPKTEDWKRAFEHFSFAEKVAFLGLFAVSVLALLNILSAINDYISVEVPVHGGSLSEGLLGSPRFINPLLAISEADRDLTMLVYSGLLKATPEGNLLPDLAESYSISTDGLVYTFVLKKEAYFHDGYPITAEDVEYTVNRAQDTAVKSPKRANWDSVRVEKISPQEIRFILNKPYAPFLENATLGILPKHLWKNISPEEFPLSFLNIEPVGSGPYTVENISRNASGIPESYELLSFPGYILGEPYLERIVLRFYPNEISLLEALEKGEVDSANGVPPDWALSVGAEKKILRTPLPRVFAVFFNQNQNQVLLNREVRLALNMSLDKKQIVEEVLQGFGVVVNSPFPTGTPISSKGEELIPESDRVAKARALLQEAKWVWNEAERVLERKEKKGKQVLSLSLSTSNAPELRKSAEIIKETWEKLGARVELKIFETGDLNQNIIRPRRYDALLFGQIIGRDLDLFAFWHSSQRNDPGLNIALYTNLKADRLLANARATGDRRERTALYRSLNEEIIKDMPAVFLYSPDFIYILPTALRGVEVERITTPAERFLGVERWYIESERVWHFLTEK